MISGNGLAVAYTPFNKPASITRGTNTISFEHDPEHQRFSQVGPPGTTLYIAGAGVLAERFAGTGGGVQWTNYLIVGGRLIGVYVQKADETTATRDFHTDHLGSIAVISNEVGAITSSWVRLPQRQRSRRPRRGDAAPPTVPFAGQACR
jgi:hypothetical protein